MFPYQCCDFTPPLPAAVPTDHDAQLFRKPLETKENGRNAGWTLQAAHHSYTGEYAPILADDVREDRWITDGFSATTTRFARQVR